MRHSLTPATSARSAACRTKPIPLDRAKSGLVLSEADVRVLLCVSRRHLYELRKTDPKFPPPLRQLSSRVLLFRRGDIEKYVARLKT